MATTIEFLIAHFRSTCQEYLPGYPAFSIAGCSVDSNMLPGVPVHHVLGYDSYIEERRFFKTKNPVS